MSVPLPAPRNPVPHPSRPVAWRAAWVAASVAALATGLASTAPLAAGPDRPRVAHDPLVGELDPRLPEYKAPAGLTGKFLFAGTQSLRSMPDEWVASFNRAAPGCEVTYEATGTRGAMPMFAGGLIPLAFGSRRITDAEREAFQNNHGYQCVELVVAVEAWGLFVHADNPVRAITLKELDGLWSSTRALGGPEIRTWDALGCGPGWDKPVTLHAADRELYRGPMPAVLDGGRFREDINTDRDDPAGVLETDRFAMVLAPANTRQPYLRPLMLKLDDGPGAAAGRAVGPTFEGLRAGWPLVKPLYLYVNKRPGRPLDPVVREFLRCVYCREAQRAASLEDRHPVSRAFGEDQLRKVE